VNPSERVSALLAEARQGRQALKRVGALLDGEPSLKAWVVQVAREAGVDLPDEAATWPGKKLARRAQGREGAARARKNPIRRDEGFRCVACGADVPPHGRTARDHCPFCLTGLHVDGDVPGDRASSCGGRLDPVGVHRASGRWVLEYRCATCGATRRNRVLLDGDPPDDWERVATLASGASS
jgi:DNA-directed RNA polymerase subunit RPC12/RpoP